jgi:hypothetical protein
MKHNFARGFLELLGELARGAPGWLQRGRNFQKLHLATTYNLTAVTKHHTIFFNREDEILVAYGKDQSGGVESRFGTRATFIRADRKRLELIMWGRISISVVCPFSLLGEN